MTCDRGGPKELCESLEELSACSGGMPSSNPCIPAAGLVRALNAGHGHRRLQQRALEQHAVVLQLGVHGGQHALLHPRGGGDVVGAVDEDLRLDLRK